MPSPVKEGRQRGYIIPIGGAEDKSGEMQILRRFVQICGRRPRIAVIPTASRLEETGRRYSDLFSQLDAGPVEVLQFQDRSDCEDAERLAWLDGCDGVFITGGNQLRLSTTLGGTPVARLLRKRNAQGMPIAGTSAGAAILPEHMIASGDEGPTPLARMVQLAPGLGVSNKIMIDQHFRQRDRLGRLLSAIALNPFAIGLGIDEDTACFIDPENVLEVVGSGAVTVVDPSRLKHSNVAETDPGKPISLTGLKVHVLVEGSRFQINQRRPLL